MTKLGREVERTPHRETLHKKGELNEIARCVTKGFDTVMLSENSLRLDETGNRAEMIGRDPDLLTSKGAFYVVEFVREESGVQLTYFIRRDVVFPAAAKDRIRAIIDGC